MLTRRFIFFLLEKKRIKTLFVHLIENHLQKQKLKEM